MRDGLAWFGVMHLGIIIIISSSMRWRLERVAGLEASARDGNITILYLTSRHSFWHGNQSYFA